MTDNRTTTKRYIEIISMVVLLLLTTVLSACQNNKEHPETVIVMSHLAEELQKTVDTLKAIQPSRMPGKKEDMFDINDYFTVLSHLSMEPGWVLGPALSRLGPCHLLGHRDSRRPAAVGLRFARARCGCISCSPTRAGPVETRQVHGIRQSEDGRTRRWRICTVRAVGAACSAVWAGFSLHKAWRTSER